MTTAVNKKLKKMVNGDSDNDIEIENQLYAMIKKLKSSKVTKQVAIMKFCKRTNGNGGFGGGGFGVRPKELFSHGVNKNGTTDQLISELNEKLKVEHCLQNVVVNQI